MQMYRIYQPANEQNTLNEQKCVCVLLLSNRFKKQNVGTELLKRISFL